MSERACVFTERDAFVIYKLPNEDKHFLVTADAAKNAKLLDVPYNSFVVGSFEKSTEKVSYIPADHIIEDGDFVFQVDSSCNIQATSKDAYLKHASDLLEELRAGSVEKVVLSRIKLVPNTEDDLYDLFVRLKNRYADAFVYMYNIPGRGCWCGATPETLVKFDEGHLETMALAGTQRNNGLSLDDIQWTQKEVHEQKVIEEFIEAELEKLDLSFFKKGPYTVEAGKVLHIRSDFKVEDVSNLPELVEALHPGPAICGRPRSQVLEMILDTEEHEREDYCGFLGPLGIENSTELYINLRCMKIFSKHLALFLGGGLTARSLPQLEWDETELKATTLLAVLEKVYS